jgi:hypothetical protein
MIVSDKNATELRTDIRDRSKFREFNLWVNDACSHEMYFMDGDGIAYRRHNRTLRLFEYKHPGETLSKGEGCILPIFSALIRLGVKSGRLSSGSGAYVITGLVPFSDGAEVRKFGGSKARHMSVEELLDLVDCEGTG